jgi:hypothetical protein
MRKTNEFMIGGLQLLHPKSTINIASEILQLMLHMDGYGSPNVHQR